MESEQAYIDAINADPDDRTLQLVYAEWLEEQGDPRAEGWRVLIEAGKRPILDYNSINPSHLFFGWSWFPDPTFEDGPSKHHWAALIPYACLEQEVWSKAKGITETFHAAMDAAAIAWVQCHRKPKESATLLQ